MISLDCLALIAALLEPHELQALRCAGRELNASVTDQMKRASLARARAKYCRAALMPDGAVRIYTRLGRQAFDLHAVPGRHQTHDGGLIKTPLYVLKQQGAGGGWGDQMGCIDYALVHGMRAISDQEFRGRVLRRGSAALLEAAEISITNVNREWEGARESTSICLKVLMPPPREGNGDYVSLTVVLEFDATVPGKAPVPRGWSAERDPK